MQCRCTNLGDQRCACLSTYSTNVPRPKPGPDDVLVQIRAVGVNPVDVVIRSSLFPFCPPFPIILGIDFAGIVEEVGSNVTTMKVGQ